MQTWGMSCGRKIGVYECCSVVQGDCLELMKALPDERLICECGMDVTGEGGLFHVVGGHKNKAVKCFDAVVTDPPYGIGASSGVGKYGVMKWGGERDAGWDKEVPSDEVFGHVLRLADKHIIWGGNYFGLPPSRCFLVWDKGAGFRERTFAECEMAWTSLDSNAKILTRDPLANGDYVGKQHPTQKPIELMAWCLRQIPDAETILDPFCGSGTTLVAAAKLGRHFLGFEISPEYCEIARKRLALVEAQPTLFEQKPEQQEFNL